MMNKAINTLVLATVDSLTKFKNKLAYYLAIFAMVFGSTFGTFNAANAGDVAITSTGAITSGNITTLLDAADGELEIQGTSGVIATLGLSIGLHADGGTNIVLGDIASGTEASTLKVVAAAAALTVDPLIKTLNAQIVGAILVQDSTAGAEGDLVTFNGIIGGGAANIIDTIQIGDADEVSGNAKFTADVKATAISVEGGDAGENSIVDFASTVTGGITMDDVASKGNATVIFSGTTRTIAATVTAETDGDGTVQVTGTGLTLNGAIGGTGIGTLDIDATAAMTAVADAKVVNIATGQTFTIDDNFTGDATTLTGTGGITFAVDADGAATTAIAAVINGAADGDGTLTYTNTAQSTQTGAVGTTNGIGTIAVGASGLIDMVGIVDTQNLTVLAGGVISFDDDATHDAAVLTTTGKIMYEEDGDGAAVATVTGTIDGAAADNGVIQTNNGSTVTFASAIGSTQSLATMTLTTQAIFNSDVSAKAITTAQSQVNDFNGDLTIGSTKFIITGAAGEAMFSGAGDQTVTGEIVGAGAEQGVIDNANTAGTVTFATALGAVELKEVELDASTTTVFNSTVKSALIDIDGTSTFKAAGNVANNLTLATGGSITIDQAITNADEIFTVGTGFVDGSIAGTGNILLPSNLIAGETLVLVAQTTDAADAAIVVDAELAVKDTALRTYTVSMVANSTNDNDIVVTSADNSISSVATNLGTTQDVARSLLQMGTASVGDSGAITALSTSLNENAVSAGVSSTVTALALQTAPQTDTIGGSSVATRAMTGTVQGIVSNRMASLRSGDAFVTGMSAGNGMSANSGFIQAFGSDGEQKNTSSSGATVYGFDTETSGVAIGFDGMTDDGSTIGLSASYSSTDVDGKGTGKSKNSIDSYTVSVYADKATENGYIEGSLTYGINENAASRLVNTAGLDRTYSADYDSNQISLKVGGGVPQEVRDGTFVTPFISATATSINTDAYTEKSTTANDALRLRVEQDDINSLVGSLGVKAHMVTDNGTPMISLAVNNEFGDSQISSQNTYQGGGTKFKTTTEVEELSATLGLGFSFGNDVTSLNLNYEANVNDDEYVNQYGSIKIVAKF
ncbi:autotransporter domain-containing protein [Candidatus Pelagibacter sp.]|nr:autotransporter domain-containing protein [Candidatus Pelagibacter sp.]